MAALGLSLAIPYDWKRAASAPFDPVSMFSGGLNGWLYNGAADQSAFLQSAGGAVCVDGDPIGFIQDLSGNGYHQAQTTGGNKTVCRVELDGTRSVYAGTAKETNATVSVPAERTEIYVFKQMQFSGSGEALLMYVTDSASLVDVISAEEDWHKYISEASDTRGLYVASMDISRPAIFVRKKTATDVQYAAYYLSDGSAIAGGGKSHAVHSTNTITTAYIGSVNAMIAHCCPFYMCIEGEPDLTDLLSYLVDTFGAWSPT